VSYSNLTRRTVFIYRRLDVNLVEIFYVNLQAAVNCEGFVRRAHFRRMCRLVIIPLPGSTRGVRLPGQPETCTGSQPKMPEFGWIAHA